MAFFPLRSPVPAKEQKEMGTITSASEELSRVTWLQLVIFIEFLASVTICIFTMIGVSIGWSVSCVFLLSLLQFGITVPGCIFSTQRVGFFLVVYIALQTTTGLCEIIWLVVNLVKSGPWYHAVGLGVLIILQFVSILVALFCRDRVVVRRHKKDLETHLSHGSPTLTTRDVEMGAQEARTDEKSNRRPPVEKTKKKRRMKKKSSRKSSVSEEGSFRGRLRTRSTQPTNTKTTPTGKAVPTMHSGQQKMDQIKKMIADMNEKSQRKRQSAEGTRSKELDMENRKTASRSERENQ